MKKLLLISSCLALTSTAAMAADMGTPYTKAPVMAAPVFSWTGCYVGAHIGGGSLSTNGVGLNNEGGFPTNNSGTNSTGRGGVAGGQLGCNYQDGNWVFGLEGEGYWSGIKANVNRTFGVGDSEGASMKNSNDFTFAARAGITFDRTLIYAKGGWAWGNYKVSLTETCCGGDPRRLLTQSKRISGRLPGRRGHRACSDPQLDREAGIRLHRLRHEEPRDNQLLATASARHRPAPPPRSARTSSCSRSASTTCSTSAGSAKTRTY